MFRESGALFKLPLTSGKYLCVYTERQNSDRLKISDSDSGCSTFTQNCPEPWLRGRGFAIIVEGLYGKWDSDSAVDRPMPVADRL
jgi:hypothetical protein